MENSYPGINWWQGNLLPHESIGSFEIRFQLFNGINRKQVHAYFDNYLDYSTCIRSKFSASELEILGEILNEPIDVVKTVFDTDLSLLKCGNYAVIQKKIVGVNKLKYCQKCLSLGYHSCLHEFNWLKKCPFHNEDLSLLIPNWKGGVSNRDRYINAISETIKHACPRWPLVNHQEISILQFSDIFVLFELWSKDAIDRTTKSSLPVLWRAEETHEQNDDGGEYLGRIRSLAPIPKKIESLFLNLEINCLLEKKILDADSVRTLEHVLFDVSIIDLVWFYKIYAVVVPASPTHIEKLRKEIENLKNHEESCKCKWGWSKFSGWTAVGEGDWPLWGYVCPYSVALAELELDCRVNANPTRGKYSLNELQKFIELARRMRILQLIDYNETCISGDGYTFAASFANPRIEWKSIVLENLLSTIAASEIDLRIDSLRFWLLSIESGNKPWRRNDPKESLTVQKESNSISIWRWKRSQERSNVGALYEAKSAASM